MFPVGFLLLFDTTVLRYESVFIIKIILNWLIFLGWLFVTYGIDLVSIPRYYILISYRSQNYGIEPSLVYTGIYTRIYIRAGRYEQKFISRYFWADLRYTVYISVFCIWIKQIKLM